MVSVVKEALNTGEDSLAADGDEAQHHQGVVDHVFEGEGEGEVEDEEAAAAAAGRYSIPEQDDNAYSQLERDIFGGSDLRTKTPRARAVRQSLFSGFEPIIRDGRTHREGDGGGSEREELQRFR